MSYYNGTRTHLSLNKDAPKSRAAETAGRILSTDPGRTAPSIWPDLICDNDRQWMSVSGRMIART